MLRCSITRESRSMGSSVAWHACSFLLQGRYPQVRRQSVGALQFRQRAIHAPQQRYQRLDALAALGPATAGGVDAARLGGAGGFGGAQYLVVGQRIAKADIHGCRILAFGGDANRLLVGSLSPAQA